MYSFYAHNAISVLNDLCIFYIDLNYNVLATPPPDWETLL